MDKKETILVGANNSGKTTAMNALIWFCKYPKAFKTKDFTLSNWVSINQIGQEWIDSGGINTNLSIDRWDNLLPYLDLWIQIESDDDNLNLVSHLIPTLEEIPSKVGLRIRFEPKDMSELYGEFIRAYQNAQLIQENRDHHVDIYPKNLYDFLDHEDSSNLKKNFEVRYYMLNEQHLNDDVIQPTPTHPIDNNILSNVIRIDIISAEREFADPQAGSNIGLNRLSAQLQDFYRSHISPTNNLTAEDVGLLEAIGDANKAFDENLKRGFRDTISELEELNYPGYLNPDIEIKSSLKPEEGIRHESAVRFKISRNDNGDGEDLGVDESYNGLGYRNLISMYFRLIQFRRNWLKQNKQRGDNADERIVPIHLVCIEEPEAHLHAQAQKVFVKRAYDTLTKDVEDSVSKRTQLLISTHSNHVVQGVDFDHVRYFKRLFDENLGIPVSEVVNMTTAFGAAVDTKRFVTRYIKLTHCDMFFADGLILVEGAAERILMPLFLEHSDLRNKYVSIIEIDGAHAHRFKPLIEKLGIYTLVVSDLDAIGKKTARNKEQRTSNYTLINWIPRKEDVDDLLDLGEDEKIQGNVRIAYQIPEKVKYKDKRRVEIIPYTFEDALAFDNMTPFINNQIQGNGITRKFCEAFQEDTAGKCHAKLLSAMYKAGGKKAQLATDLLLWNDADNDLYAPHYIEEGLNWLNEKLRTEQES